MKTKLSLGAGERSAGIGGLLSFLVYRLFYELGQE